MVQTSPLFLATVIAALAVAPSFSLPIEDRAILARGENLEARFFGALIGAAVKIGVKAGVKKGVKHGAKHAGHEAQNRITGGRRRHRRELDSELELTARDVADEYLSELAARDIENEVYGRDLAELD